MATGVASWSQTAASNSNADANVNWAEGMAPAAVNNSARAQMASVAMYRDDVAGSLTTGGTSTAYTVTTNQGFSSLTLLNERKLTIRFNATNGASPTLNVDGLGAKSIKIDATTAVAAGAIRADSIHTLTYDSSDAIFILHHGHSLNPPGFISAHGSSTVPPGWLLCDGTAVSRTTYADLFAIISTTFGTGDGSTTFNVPDLAGRVPVGVDGTTNRITTGVSGIDGLLGSAGGDQNVGAHTHTITDPGHDHNINVDGSSNVGSANGFARSDLTTLSITKANGAVSETTGITVNSGGTGSSGNVQPSLIVNYIIKV